MLDSPDERWLSSLCRMVAVLNDPLIREVAARTALSMGNTLLARELIERPGSLPDDTVLEIKSEILLMEGDDVGALRNAVDGYTGDPLSALSISRAYIGTGKPGCAKPFLRKAKTAMLDSGCLYGLDEAYRLEAVVMMHEDRYPEAVERLRLASESALDERRRSIISGMADSLDRAVSEHRVGPEVIQVGDVEIPDVLYVPFEHSQPLESESPCEDGVLHSEGRHDLGPEYAGASELHPLPVEEYLQLQRGLGVGEVSGAYADLVESHPGVELPDDRHQHIEVGVLVDDDALDLGEFGQVGGVD